MAVQYRIVGGSAGLFQQRIALGSRGPVQILLHLGATFRRVLLAAIASACVDHQKDPIRISLGNPDRRLRQCCFVC